MDPDERHDDFADPAPWEDGQAAENARAANPTTRHTAARAELHQERAARDTLYGDRSGNVTAAPIDPPMVGGGPGTTPRPLAHLGAPTRQDRPESSTEKAPAPVRWPGAMTDSR